MGYGLRYPLTFDFNVSNKRIYFVGDPINPQDAVNKRYVDNLFRNTLKYPLTHDFNANAFSVTNLATGQPLNGSNSLTYDDASNVFLKQTGTNVNLNMNGKNITGLDQSYPVSDNSQAVCWYQVLNFVNGKRVKNNVGFIPDLYGRANKKGFIVTTNSQLNSNSSPKSIFNDSSNEWSSSGMQENVWVQIQLPTPLCIWKFTIAGKMNNSEKWYDWVFEGSKDTFTWTILKSAIGDHLGPIIKTYILHSPSESFLFYRFYGFQGEATNPGLSHLQIYAVDDLL